MSKAKGEDVIDRRRVKVLGPNGPIIPRGGIRGCDRSAVSVSSEMLNREPEVASVRLLSSFSKLSVCRRASLARAHRPLIRSVESKRRPDRAPRRR
jgi:hypothetical protein